MLSAAPDTNLGSYAAACQKLHTPGRRVQTLVALLLTGLLASLLTPGLAHAESSGENIGNAIALGSGAASGELPSATTDRWYVFQAEGTVTAKVINTSPGANPCNFGMNLDWDGVESIRRDFAQAGESRTLQVITPGRYFIELSDYGGCPVGAQQPVSYQLTLSGALGSGATAAPTMLAGAAGPADAPVLQGAINYSGTLANPTLSGESEWFEFYDNGKEPDVSIRAENTSNAEIPIAVNVCGLLVRVIRAEPSGEVVSSQSIPTNFAWTTTVSTPGLYYVRLSGYSSTCPVGANPVADQLRIEPADGVSTPPSGSGGTGSGETSPGSGTPLLKGSVEVDEPAPAPDPGADQDGEDEEGPEGPAGAAALAIPLIERFEGFRAHPYNDQGGHCTIGYGTKLSNGPCTSAIRRMYAGGISKAAATQLLRQRLGVAERAVSGAIPGPLAPNVRAALESFAYNVGPSAFSTSTLVKLFNAGQRAAAADELLRWVHTGGKVSQGLLNRRNAERNLMLYGNPDGPPHPGARPGGPTDPSGSRHTLA